MPSLNLAHAPRRVPPSTPRPSTLAPSTLAPNIGPSSTVPPHAFPLDGGTRPAELGTALIDATGAVEDEDHILVLGGQGPELMCGLLRAGAANVTHLRAHERPEPDSASLVIVPRVASLEWLATALPSIRRALTGGGRLMLRVGGQPTTQSQIRRMLTLNGLSAIRARTTGDGQIVSAERPLRHSA
jgi:hypothetical protein